MKPIPEVGPYTTRLRPESARRGAVRLTMIRSALLASALLAAMTVVMAVSARPAAAQSGEEQYGTEKPSGLMIEATGTLERLDPATYGYGEYLISDEESGQRYALDDGGQGLLEPYVGQRVTVTGSEPAAGAAPTDPRLLNVLQVEPAGEAPEGPDNTGSITFEVNTEGQIPEGAKFFGVYGEPDDPDGEIPPFGQLGVVNLHDSDSDGTYTATADVPQGESLALIASGDAAGPRQKIHPQSSIQRDSTINVSGNELVSATVSFPAPEQSEEAGGAERTEQMERTERTEQELPEGDAPEAEEDSPGPTITVLPDTGGAPVLPAAGVLLAGALTTLGLLVRGRK